VVLVIKGPLINEPAVGEDTFFPSSVTGGGGGGRGGGDFFMFSLEGKRHQHLEPLNA